MAIIYEVNPPKILPGADTEQAISRFVEKIKIISKKCDAIHITENVLGHQRASPIKVGKIIKSQIPDLPITVSLRVRDKSEKEISEFVDSCILIGISGILIVMGDPSQNKKADSGNIPSQTIQRLREQGIDSKIDLYLSVSNKPDFSKIGKKLKARPKGFMTQVVQNIDQVQSLCDNLKGFTVIPIILFPSEKNEKSAKFLNLDLGEYRQGFEEFVKRAHDIAGNVLVTSPNDFGGVNEFLGKLYG